MSQQVRVPDDREANGADGTPSGDGGPSGGDEGGSPGGGGSSSGGGDGLRSVGVAILLWFAAFVLANLLGLVPFVALVVQVGAVPDALPLWVSFGALVLVELGYLTVGGGYVLYRYGGLDASLPTPRGLAWTAAAVVAALGVALASSVVTSVFEVRSPGSTIEMQFGEPAALVGLGILSVVLVGPAEELLFRGAIQRRLRETWGAWPAILGASVLFLGVHLFNFVGGSALGVLLSFATLFGVSVVLGVVYERTGNLAVPVVAHGLYNATLAGLSVLSMAGGS